MFVSQYHASHVHGTHRFFYNFDLGYYRALRSEETIIWDVQEDRSALFYVWDGGIPGDSWDGWPVKARNGTTSVEPGARHDTARPCALGLGMGLLEYGTNCEVISLIHTPGARCCNHC